MRKLRASALLACTLFAATSLCAQQPNMPHGNALCNDTAAFLTTAGFAPVRESLVPSVSNDFPYNITVYQKATKSYEGNSGRSTLILAFTMEDVYMHRPLIENILTKIKKIERDYNMLILVSYGDFQITDDALVVRGTNVFTENIESPDDCTAVCISFTPDENAAIVPGGGGSVSPHWLVSRLAHACNSSGMPFSLHGGSLGSLFKLKILTTEARTALFLERDIPCAAFAIPLACAEDSCVNFFSTFLSSYSAKDTDAWDKHYIFFRAGGAFFLINEQFIIACFIFIAFVSLFILCEFSFNVSKRRRETRRDVYRLWYVLPATVVICALTFQTSQLLVRVLSHVISINVREQIILKITAAFIAVTAIYFFQVQHQGTLEKRAYGYILTLVSVLNIFIFCAVDISLFFLFTIEYIIVYTSRPLKRVWQLIISFALMAIPFMPYVIQIIKYGTASTAHYMAYSSFIHNMLFAFLFLPFLLQWLRIIARANARWKKLALTAKGIRVRNTVISATATVIIVLLLVVAVRYIPTLLISSERRSMPPAMSMQQRDDGLITCTVSDRSFFGDTSRTLTIRLGAEAEQCTVAIRGAHSNAVIYSDAQHVSDTTSKTDTFIMPTWPPKTLTFSYAADASTSSTVTITAIYPSSKTGERIMRTHAVEIPALAKTGAEAL
ncbi:MAG: hypothetical protein IJR50_08565 [Treponema sp.]|nr:hypothetical protein [Treponema sp.]